MTSFRFIHAADIHLDSPLRGLAGEDGSAAERIRSATRDALETLVATAIEEQVAFLIIAGDLYDGDWRDFGTGLFFVAQMTRLRDAGIPVFLIQGNHDAESQMTKSLPLPDNVHSFSARSAESIDLGETGAALHGQSFRVRDVTDNLVPAYPAPVSGRFNIGILHTGLGGREGHANYAPCSLGDLVAKGYDYWALGHVHQAEILHENPHIVFSGNLQGRHVRETGPKGAFLVDVVDGRVDRCTFLPMDVARWEVLSVSLDGCSTLATVHDRMQEALASALRENTDGRILACRLVLTGETSLHDLLQISTETLLADLRAIALGLGQDMVHVEKVIVDSTAPVAQVDREDALGDLTRLLASAVDDPDLLAKLAEELGPFVKRLPPEILTGTEDTLLRAAIDGDGAGLVSAARSHVLAGLAQGD